MVDGVPDPKARRPQGSRRGTYDRHASPSERAREQRAELLLAVRQLVAAKAGLSVSSIAGHRGLGRNTFYEHFTTVEAAVVASVEEAGGVLTRVLAAALETDALVTPSEHGRRFAAALTGFVAEEGERWAVLSAHGEEALDAALRAGITRVHGSYVDAGAGRATWSLLNMASACGAVRGVLREGERGEASFEELSEELAAVLGRLLR